MKPKSKSSENTILLPKPVPISADELDTNGPIYSTIELMIAYIEGSADCVARYLPKKILKSGNRTIVFWLDGTKTIVKRSKSEPDDTYAAFTAALGIKLFGSNSALKKVINGKTEFQKTKDGEYV